jgi:hypothetical protein
MSALLNHNKRREISWKGRTINQITSTIKKNGRENENVTGDVIFRAMPLKIYRREIAVNIPQNQTCHNSRVSSSIDELNMPGGYLLSKSNTIPEHIGQFNTLESPSTGNLNATYGCNGVGRANSSYNCAENNARRRCRSSGIIKRVYNPSRSELAYFTNTNQYLVSRSKTFSQNQYRHVRPNDVSIINNPLHTKETYSPNGISHCPKAYIAQGANVFYYYWIDSIGAAGDFSSTAKRHTVTIPPGYYDVNDLNSAFETVMYQNKHFFVYNHTNSNVFLMKIIYNNTNNCIEIQTFSSASVSNVSMYSVPFGAAWIRPTVNVVPVYYIPMTGMQNVIGFSSGFYPNMSANSSSNITLNGASYGALSNVLHKIYPSYSITYYKPSNNRFATQGGVSSSDMTQRIKYDTISRNGLAYSTAFGSQVGKSMSYGVSDQVYTIKDKLGYPLTQTPVFDKYTGKMKCLANGKFSGRCASAPNE